MVTERTIINGLIIGASFILVPFIISESLTVDYLPALCLFGLGALVISFFFVKENLAIGPFVCTFFAGVLNFLPLPLAATHVVSILLILYFVTGYVIIRQRPIKLGKPMLLWPIAFVTGIILYHNHSLSFGALGGSTEGAKPAILIYIVVIAYFCSINLPSPSVEVFSRIPRYAVIASVLSSIPYLLTTWIPGLAPYLYLITDTVNVESYFDSLSGGGGGALGKLAAFGPLGGTIQLYLLAHYPIGTWLRPPRWWVAGVSLICAILVASSGYRNDMFTYLATILVASWCYYSWRSVILPVTFVFVGTAILVAGSNDLIHLPLRQLPIITQRTLSFLPGDWDPQAIDSGKSSNDFRSQIANVYLNEYAARSPILGNGFTIDNKLFTEYSEQFKHGGGDMNYLQAKMYIEGKMFHTGWISLYDCVGIAGAIAFFALAWNEIRIMLRFLFGPNSDRRSSLYPLYVWLFTNFVSGFISYFTVFGGISAEYTTMILNAMVLSHLADLARKTEVPLIPGEIKGHVEMPRISGAYYGRK